MEIFRCPDKAKGMLQIMNKIIVKNCKKNYMLYKKKTDKLKEVFSVSNTLYHTNFYALNGVSFAVNEGECLGIIGLNGSGKSTLLKILSGVITQTEGTVEVNGKVSALLELGAGFNPEYTGYENIFLNGMIMGYSAEDIKKKLADILSFADIGDFINQPVKMYSSGMFVRLAFAIAISVEPDILIIDEALSVGDVFFQQKCYKKIKELAKKSTVIIVSHDLNALTKFCNRIIVMDKGQIEYDGEPVEGVAYFYKIKQGNLFGSEREKKLDKEEKYDKFIIPDEDKYSGSMDVLIKKFFYSIDGIPFKENCEQGAQFVIKLLVEANRPIDSLIVGYQVRDKYGAEIFGENSLTSRVIQEGISKGENLISFNFTWPEVREGDYFITIGIGEGEEVLNQVEQCWINNAIHVDATTYGKVIYGIFNNEIEEFMVEVVEGEMSNE